MSKEVKLIPYPECCKYCRIIDELGAEECENVCPEKFKEGGESK